MGHILTTPVESKWIVKHGNHWLRVGGAEMQGYRVNMEDTMTICTSLPKHPDIALFGIFDGHSGTAASIFMRDQIVNKINALSDPTDHAQLKQAIIELDTEFCKDIDRRMNGSTACIALVTPINQTNGKVTPVNTNENTSSNVNNNNTDTKRNSISSTQQGTTSASKKSLHSYRSSMSNSTQKQRYKVLFVSVGDSRAILIEPNGDVSGVTQDHKPDNTGEMDRIKAAGGSVSFGRVDGELAMSRAIGDYSYKCDSKLPNDKQKVISVPDITELTADETDEILLCCDGLFEKLTTEQVAAFTHYASKLDSETYQTDPAQICSILLDYSLAKGSKDNQSAMLIQFTDGTAYERSKGELIAGSLENIDYESDRKFLETYIDYAKIHLPNITFDTLRSMAADTESVRQAYCQQLDRLEEYMAEWKDVQKKRGTWLEQDMDDQDEII